MKKIYLDSNLFWIASKFIFTFFLIFFPGYVLILGGLKIEELLYTLFLFFEGIILAITLKEVFVKNADLSGLRKLSGGILILFGIGLMIFLLTLSKGSRNDLYGLGLFLSLWILLVGIYDILGVKKEEEN
jgi:hypothetical protein